MTGNLYVPRQRKGRVPGVIYVCGHAEGPIFLNVMRYTDLPEAAALVAPRRVTFYGRMPAAYEYTRHIWRLYGKPAGIETSVRVDWRQQ